MRCVGASSRLASGGSSQSNREPGVMHLFRYLIFIEAQLGCYSMGNTYIQVAITSPMNCHVIMCPLFPLKDAVGHQPANAHVSQLLSLLLNPQANWVYGTSSSALLSARLSLSTHKMYGSAMKHFHNFCAHFNVVSPFPVMEHLLCCFAAFLANQGLTCNGYLPAVRSMLGLPDSRDQFSLPMLKRVQEGIQYVRSLAGPPSHTRLPITASVVENIRV